MAKVEAPNKDYNGPGPGDAKFENGVAHTDDENALNYYRSAGYTVDGDVESPIETPESPDPRDYEDEILGTRLRDAAVDPHEDDFLAPINAGEANPHGPNVVSPEIHASGPAGIRPGDVIVEDARKQEAREVAFAEARLIDNVTAAKAVADEVDVKDRGEIGLSDPGSADKGRKNAEASDDAESGAVPAKADNKAAWVAYAVAQGVDEAEAEGFTKAELVERYSA